MGKGSVEAGRLVGGGGMCIGLDTSRSGKEDILKVTKEIVTGIARGCECGRVSNKRGLEGKCRVQGAAGGQH